MALAVDKYVAEFIGTFLLVLTVGCNVLSPAPKEGLSSWAATSIACVLMVSIYALGSVSGANFNPAVSLCLGVTGKLGIKDMCIYIVVQLIAGVTAGCSYWMLFGITFNLQPGATFGWWEAAIVEVLYTFMLCFVVLNVAASTASQTAVKITFNPQKLMREQPNSIKQKIESLLRDHRLSPVVIVGSEKNLVRVELRDGLTSDQVKGIVKSELNIWDPEFEVEGNQYYGLAIGFVIIAGGYAGGNVSGGCFNPAVAFGIDIPSAGTGFGWCFAYLGFEMIGAGLASLLFRVVRPEDFGKDQTDSVAPKLVSEFLGTFFLVFTVGMNVLGGGPGPGGAAFSIGAALMCMIYALGSVSGAHFNPAVTVAILLSGRKKISGKDAGLYIVTQLFAGILAAFSYSSVHHGRTFPLLPNSAKGHGWFDVAIGEIVFTFVLCFTVLSVATCDAMVAQKPIQGQLPVSYANLHAKDMFGFLIGSCVWVGGIAVGGVGAGSLNPAVSFGIASANIMNGGIFVNSLAYMFFEVIGAAMASGAFFVTHEAEYPRQKDSDLSYTTM